MEKNERVPKVEYLNSVKLQLKEKYDREITTAMLGDVVKAMEDVVEKEVLAGKKISPLSFISISPSMRKGRKGKLAFGPKKGQEWKSEDKKIAKIKLTKSFLMKFE